MYHMKQYQCRLIRAFHLKQIYSVWCWLFVFIFITLAYVATLIQKEYFNASNKQITQSVQYCYICDNYASLSADFSMRPGPGTGLAWFGGKPIVGGWTRISSNGNQLQNGLTSLQMSRLCSERVNRSAITLLIDSDNYGKCENINYNGCAKIVTKSWRVRSQLGVPVLTAVVVSRTCATIPEGYGVGCFNSVGGAGMRRTICYCRGNFCNDSRKTKEIRNYFIIFLFTMIIFYIWFN
ncbi:Palmitoyltransferase-like protein [Schistosoma japonicum]|nr:Palmitoyltransferase-like protein [Schistosoma japonicum]